MKKLILFFVVALVFSTNAIGDNFNHILVPDYSHCFNYEINEDEEFVVVPSRTGHMIGTWEFEVSVLGLIKFKVTGIRCDDTPNVTCVMKEGVPTETAIKSADGSVIAEGDFSHEEIEPQSDGSTVYLFYFNVDSPTIVE